MPHFERAKYPQVTWITDVFPNVPVRRAFPPRGRGQGRSEDRMGACLERERRTDICMPLPPPASPDSPASPPPPQDVTDEHFMVWMRPAALPRFRKLYGRIEQDLPAGATLNFVVASVFPVQPFGGTKSLVLATTTLVGAPNPFLATAFIATGAALLALGAAVPLRAFFGGRRLGDTAFLRWPSAPRAAKR